MTRPIARFFAVVAAVLASLGLVFAFAGQAAIAQDDGQAEPATYPGPFVTDDDAGDAPEPTPTPDASTTSTDAADEVLGATATSDAASAVSGSGALAATGSDVEPIVALSLGLLAVGGSVLVGSRRSLRDFFS